MPRCLKHAACACGGLLVLLLTSLALPGMAAAAPLPADFTAVLSGTPDLTAPLPAPVNSSFAGVQAVSGDGRFVTFASDSDGLDPAADPDVRNVFVKDMSTGAVTLVSRADGPNGEPSHSNCSQPAISRDGTHVAFVCEGPLDPADTNGLDDVYVRDLTTGSTALVSRLPGGGLVGNGDSDQPSIDRNGTHVAFTTGSTNFGDGADPSNRNFRVYVRTLGATDALTLASRATGANGADCGSGTCDHPSISNDGSRVAFESAGSLDAADDNTHRDIYLRDLGAKTTELVSRGTGSTGKVGNGDSTQPLISGDGSVVAFSSVSTTFDPVRDPIEDSDVYRRLLTLSTTQLVSQTDAGVKGNRESFATGIDDTGDRVAFITQSNNLDGADTAASGDDIYVSAQGGPTLASRGNGTPALGIAATGAVSGDGLSVVMQLDGAATPDAEPNTETVALRRLDAGTTATASRPPGSAPFVNQGGGAFTSAVNADGRYVAFASNARGLGLPPGIDRGVFVRDTLTGATVLVSREDGQNGAPMGPNPFNPKISADGRRVVFELNDGTDFGTDSIWLRDIPSGRTFRVDRANGPNGAPANGGSFDPTISDDGSRVAFLTGASNLGDGDTDFQNDVHVRDLAAGTTILASRADGPNGAKENAPVAEAQISGNGGRVVFSTKATNLNDGDTSPNEDVHLRDLDSGDTTLISAGGGGQQDSESPSISSDGMRVSFLSEGNFGFDPPGQKIYVRDLANHGQLIVAGRADGKDGAPLLSRGFGPPQISPNGNAVAWEATVDESVAPGAPADGSDQIFVRNLSAGTTRLVSRRSGGAGIPLPFDDRPDLGGLTADGGCVVFDAGGRLLPQPISADFSQIYMRVFEPDCGGRATGASVLSPAAADKTAPRITKAKLSRKRFRVGAKPTALRARARARVGTGTVLSLRVSEAATLTVTVDGQRIVRKKGKARRVVRRDGTLVRALKAGPARIPFSGRLGKKRLSAGRHRLTLVARDTAGNLSKRVVLQFTVVR